MGELSDRLLVLLIAATGLLVLLVGWELALVEALEMELAGRVEAVLYAAVIVVFILWLSAPGSKPDGLTKIGTDLQAQSQGPKILDSCWDLENVR